MFDWKHALLLAALCVIPSAHANTDDYIWNEQYKKKLVEAQAGDTSAQYEVGNLYLKGRGTDIDDEEAFKWFSTAAEKGHKKAEYKVGYMYMTGRGVSKDYGKAMRWLTLAANKGYGPAQFYLGRMYARGQGVDRDHEKALAWFTEAQKSGYGPATQAANTAKAQLESEKRQIAKVRETAPRAAPQARAAPAPKPPAVVAKAKGKTDTKTTNALDARTELQDSLWTSNGEPARELPSLFNDCKFQDERIVCLTKELVHITDDADISYLMEAIIDNFQGGDGFDVSYRKNVTQVMAADLDDPDATVPGIKLGWHDKQTMKCTFKNRNLVACMNDDRRVQAYSRQ